MIKDDLWVNPLNYYLVPDIEVENPGDEDDNSDCEEDNEEECEVEEVQTEDVEVQQQEGDDV